MRTLSGSRNLVIALVFGLCSAISIHQYTKSVEARLLSKNAEIPVVIAVRDIEPGHPIQSSSVGIKLISKNSAIEGSVSSLDSIVGKVCSYSIMKGEQVLPHRLLAIDDDGSTYVNIPSGHRAVTISPDDLMSTTGLVKIGDHIDLVLANDQYGAEQKVTVVENVLVARTSVTGSKTQTSDKTDVSAPSTLTVVLDPKRAEQVAYADEFGKVRIALRPSDTYGTDTDTDTDTNPSSGHASTSTGVVTIDSLKNNIEHVPSPAPKSRESTIPVVYKTATNTPKQPLSRSNSSLRPNNEVRPGTHKKEPDNSTIEVIKGIESSLITVVE